MIPIGDDVPSRSFPYVNYGLIFINIFVFIYELSLAGSLPSFINSYGIVPKDVTLALATADSSALNRLFSSLFLHAGWLHLAGNMLYLWIFGDNIEDRLGHFRYLLFYLFAGAVAMGAHVASMPASNQPAIGASGAIAGVLGAYLVMFPRARVFIVVPLFLFFPVVAIRAIFVLGFWFFEQLLTGVGSILDPRAAQGVAWWAHIGGFMAGIVFVRFFIKKRDLKFVRL